MIKKSILSFFIIFSVVVTAQRRKQSWTEQVRFSVEPHVKILLPMGNNFLNDSFSYFYGFGIGLSTNLYKNFGAGVEYSYFLANVKEGSTFGYLGGPKLNNFDWYIFHKDKITDEFSVEEILGYSTYRMKSPFLDSNGTFSEGNSGLNLGAKAIYVLDVEGFQEIVFGGKLNFYNSKIRNQNPATEKYFSKALLLNISLAYRYNF